MEQLTGRVALVTGASQGIGAGLVKALVKHGMKVVGCARNIANLQNLRDELSGESGIMVPIQCDLSKPKQVLSMFDAIKRDPNLGGVDICINNAGLGGGGSILTGDYKKWKEAIEVNVLGLCLCSQEAYKSMKERKVDDGHIILINSTLGHAVFPWSASHFYTATKFAVTAITEGLRQELREVKSGIRVTAVSPGWVQTDMTTRSLKNEEVARMVREASPILQVEDLAKLVLFILQSPPHVEHRQLSLIGGTNTKDTVRRLLRHLMTDNLALEFSWKGLQGKHSFEQLALKKVLMKAMRQNPETKNVCESFVQQFTIDWFRYAKDRNGGRKARLMKKFAEEGKQTQ